MKPSDPISMPLPRRWPRRIKTALLHAIELERAALLEVRAGFESSTDPRAALVAEIDRLREILSLKSECLWKILVPLSLPRVEGEIAGVYALIQRTSPPCRARRRHAAELRDGRVRASKLPCIETRAPMPLARGHPDRATPMRRRARGYPMHRARS